MGSKVEAIISSTFPLPIAVAFLQEPASALEATIRHLAILCASDALAGNADNRAREELSSTINNLKKPLPGAKWLEVLRLSLRSLEQEERRPLITGIDAWFRVRADSLEEALELRAKGRSHDGEVERRTVEVLGSLGCLGTTRLAWIDNASKVKGVHTALVLWLDGVRSSQGMIELSEDVQSDLVYAISPSTHTLLSLDPFYRAIKCPECQELHLFQLMDRAHAKLRFVAVGIGHRAIVDDRAPSLRRFLRGHRGRHQVARMSIPLALHAPTLSRGDVVGGRYRIQNSLREGALGHMFVATDQTTHRSIALEILPRWPTSDAALRERIRAEVAVAGTIHHQHLLPILDGSSAHDLHVAYELPNGWAKKNGGHALDVSDLERPVAPDVVANIGRQALDGLAFLHGRGLVHGGLSPKSLVLFGGGIVKITDYAFPKARAAILLNLTGVCADRKYMAPEQEAGEEADLTPRTDIYSLGKILKDLVLAKGSATPPNWLVAAIAKAIELDPARRFETAPAFHDALNPRAQARLKKGVFNAWFEVVEARAAASREGERVPIAQDRALTLGDDRANVKIAGLSGTAAIIEWSAEQQTFTIRHGGMSPTIPIHTTVDGQVLSHFTDAPPRVLNDHAIIVVQMLGRPLLAGTFRIESRPPPIPARFVKFKCNRCGAAHQVERDKIGDRTVRAQCKKCSSAIIIRASA